MAQLPKGGLVRGYNKPIHGSCTIYFPGGISSCNIAFFHCFMIFMSYIFTCLRSSSPRRCCLFPTWWWVQRHRKGYKVRFGSCDRWKPRWFEPLSTAICVLECKHSHYFPTIYNVGWSSTQFRSGIVHYIPITRISIIQCGMSLSPFCRHHQWPLAHVGVYVKI